MGETQLRCRWDEIHSLLTQISNHSRWKRNAEMKPCCSLTLHSFPGGCLGVSEAWDDLLVDLRKASGVNSRSSDSKAHSLSSQSYLESDLYFVVHSLLQHKCVLLYIFQVPCQDRDAVWPCVGMIHAGYNVAGLGVNRRGPQACFASQEVLCLTSVRALQCCDVTSAQTQAWAPMTRNRSDRWQ